MNESDGKYIKRASSGLAKISEALESGLYLDDILKIIVNVTAEVMNSKICSLMLVDEKNGELVVKATQSISEKYNRKPNLKIGEGIAGKVALTGKPIVSRDVKKDPEYVNREIAVSENLCSLVSVPMIFKGKTTGVLNCYTSRPREFNEAEINILKSVAALAALVIENFNLLAETEAVKEELETRKKVEKAKGILMRKSGISEEEAYEVLRRCSMDERKPMKEICEAIITTENITQHLTKKGKNAKI